MCSLSFLCNVHYDLNLPGDAYWHRARTRVTRKISRAVRTPSFRTYRVMLTSIHQARDPRPPCLFLFSFRFLVFVYRAEVTTVREVREGGEP